MNCSTFSKTKFGLVKHSIYFYYICKYCTCVQFVKDYFRLFWFFVNCRIYVFQLFCAAFSNFSTFRKKTYTFAVGRNTCDSKKWYLCLVIWFMKADIDLLFLLKCQTIWHLEFFIRHKLNFSPLERSQATFLWIRLTEEVDLNQII